MIPVRVDMYQIVMMQFREREFPDLGAFANCRKTNDRRLPPAVARASALSNLHDRAALPRLRNQKTTGKLHQS